MRTGKTCRVVGCRLTGTTPVEMPGAELLPEVLVCGSHDQEIKRDPAAWCLTAPVPRGVEPTEGETLPVLIRREDLD